MPKLRRFLRGCFGYAAFLYFLASFWIVKGFLHGLVSPAPNRASHHHHSMNLVAIGLAALSMLIRATPVILTVANGMAWWTFKTEKPSARVWAITASASIFLTSILLLVGGIYAQRHVDGARGHGHPNGFFLLFDIHLFVGLAGLIEFARRSDETGIADAPPTSIDGDGTSKAFDALVLIIQLGGVAAGMSLYMGWSRSRHLQIVSGYLSLLQVAVVLIAVTVIHESAHAFAGSLLGMRLRSFIVGPFQWRNSGSRWVFAFRPGQFLAVSGAAGLVPTNSNQSRWIEITTIAAGPGSNLLSGAIAATLAYFAQGRAWEPLWEFFALFATVSFVIFVVNLIPFRSESLYSDGARIYQILRGGPLADYHQVLAFVSSTHVTPLRPRDFDIEAIGRASAYFGTGPRALRLRLIAAEYYFDRKRYAEYGAAIAEAEHICQDSVSDIYAAVVLSVIQPHPDAGAAGRWWKRIESRTPSQLNAGYWLAKCAICSAQNDLSAAHDALTTADAILQSLPAAGIYEFNRDCRNALKKQLDSHAIIACSQPATKLNQLELLPTHATD